MAVIVGFGATLSAASERGESEANGSDGVQRL